MHVFLDESGTFAKGDDHYFLVGAFTVGDIKRTAKEWRRWQQEKFPRALRNLPEVKFSNPVVDEGLRLKTLKFIADLDTRIVYTYLFKKNIPPDFRKKQKITKTGLLYGQIVGDTLTLLTPSADSEFRVYRDPRTLKGITREEFNEILETRITPFLPKQALFRVETPDSSTNPNMQIIDWICGALARYYNKKELGDEFYKILGNNILKQKELFSK